MSDKDICWTYSHPVPGLLPWQSYFLAFVLGVFAVRYPAPALVALTLFFVADRSLRAKACRLPLLVVVCCAAFGFGYGTQRTPDLPESLPAWVEERQPVLVEAKVDSIETRTNHRLRVILKDVQYTYDGAEKVLPGRVAWSIRYPKYIPSPGQHVQVKLRIVPVRSFGNPGGWDYGWYWQRQGVFWRAWKSGKASPLWGESPDDLMWAIKSRFRSVVAEYVPETQGGAMVLALVTGDRSGLTLKTMEATRAAGLAHTLALSGLHVGFVAALGLGLAWFVGWCYPPLLLSIPRPKLAVLLAAPLVIGYAWLGQPSASLVRAATMFGFWGILLLQGRGRILMDGLFFALLFIVLYSPLSVFDLSLQMSAVAVGGIGLMYPYLRSLFTLGNSGWQRFLGWCGGVLAISLCANTALLPLISWYFGTMSPNIILNLLWLPVLGLVVMPLGIVGMLFSSFTLSSAVGGFLLGWASVVMDWLLAILHGGADFGVMPVLAVLRPLWPEVLGFTLLLVLAVIVWAGRKPSIGLAGIGFAFLVIPHVFVMAVDAQDKTRLTMLDVGLGQSLVLSVPGGHRWVLDGGGGSSSFDLGEAVVAPYLTYGRPPRVDGVFMTHPDVDHSHGLPIILSRFDVGAFYTNGQFPRGRTGKRMRSALKLRGIEPIPLRTGTVLNLPNQIILDVLHPSELFRNSKANEHSLVMRLIRNGNPLAFLPGDVEKDGIEALLKQEKDIQAEVLVLPHHGSKTSFEPMFYRAVSPAAVLCSNGYLNRYGFPSEEVVDEVVVPVYATSRHGLIDAVWNADGDLTIFAYHP